MRGMVSPKPHVPLTPVVVTTPLNGFFIRYHWTCTAASSPIWPCFDDYTLYRVDTQAPAISFPAKWLSECCDQFLVTLTVSSSGRNSSQALTFLSTRPDLAFRYPCILAYGGNFKKKNLFMEQYEVRPCGNHTSKGEEDGCQGEASDLDSSVSPRLTVTQQQL